MSETIHIRRYPNRRFYDRSASKYISLEEIEKIIRSGKTVEIRDSQSDEDLTRSVLTRLIVDRNPEKMELFPTAMLHFILRSNEITSDFLRDYFRHSLTYLEYLQQHSAATPIHWVKAWLDGIRKRPEDQGEPQAAPDDNRAEELARRVAELEERIRQLEGSEQKEVPIGNNKHA